nr:MAG TPA: hypothetical protein [Caudoviricetes sp.]
MNWFKKLKMWQKILIVFLVIGVIGSAIGGGSSKSEEEKENNKSEQKEEKKEEKKNLGKYDKELISGNYIAGTDFEAGTYNIDAVSGNGNISSSNLYDGGINAMMGKGDSIYERKYINIELPKDAELKISGGLKVKLTPVK